MSSPRNALPIWLRIVHWIVIANFLLEIGYCTYMVFVVLAPEGVSGPLMGAGASLPFEPMVKRRLYASEAWIAIAGLSIYLAVTEILPRRLAALRAT